MLYSLIRINESSPYRVGQYDEWTVHFETDLCIGYKVTFAIDNNIGIPKAYQLIVETSSNEKVPGPDFKIGKTIASILTAFFESDQEHILLYLCDPDDGRAAARNRKFCWWFEKYADMERLSMINKAISIDNTTYYIAAIYHKQTKSAADLETLFNSFIKNLQSK